MSLNAAALRLMREKGLSLEDVVEIAAAMEARRDVTGAERQQRYRDRHKVTRDVTRDVSPNDISSSTPLGSPSETSSLPVKRSPKKDEFVCPERVEPSHWRDFLANRKRKRLPNTDTAYAGVLRDIEKFTDDEWPPGRIVQHAAEKGWGGIYDPRPKDQSNGSQAGRPHPQSIAARFDAGRTGDDREPDSGSRDALQAGEPVRH